MRRKNKDDPRPKDLEKTATEAIDEARMVLPGIQALFGFQLIAVFNQGFHDLAQREQFLHYVALLLVALAIGIIMTPAAYHRIVEQGSVSVFFVHLISWLIAAAMVPLTLALCLEVHVIGSLLLPEPWSALAPVVLLLVFTGLWFAFPLWMRAHRR